MDNICKETNRKNIYKIHKLHTFQLIYFYEIKLIRLQFNKKLLMIFKKINKNFYNIKEIRATVRNNLKFFIESGN